MNEAARNVAVIAGNGFSISLRWSGRQSRYASAKVIPRLKPWNTSSPLSWPVRLRGQRTPLIDVLPEARRALEESYQTNPTGLNDFERIAKMLAIADAYGDYRAVSDMRHLLIMYFSFYQEQADYCNRPMDWYWRWGRFVADNSDRIGFVCSFNYDLNIERVLTRPYVHLAVNDRQVSREDMDEGVIPIFKPHGSINYGMHPSTYKLEGKPTYPPMTAHRNDYAFALVPDIELRKPRLFADGLILPNEVADNRGAPWVRSSYRRLESFSDHYRFPILLIVGLSYSDADRLEVQDLLSCFPRNAVAIYADPKPNELLVAELERRFDTVVPWVNGPEMLPAAPPTRTNWILTRK